jgi:hypothetical protein
MNRLRVILSLTFIVALVLGSCEETFEPKREAVQYTKDNLLNDINYGWFKSYWILYEPDSSFIDSVKSVYNPNIHKFVFFIEPSCECKQIERSPADLLKCFDNAEIMESNYEIYSLGTLDSEHPYSDQIHISILPAAYLLKSGQSVYSILETFRNARLANDSIFVEEFLFDALKKNQ